MPAANLTDRDCGFISTPRLIFCKWTENDIGLATELWGDPEVTRYISATGFTPADIAQKLRTEIDNGNRFGLQYWPMFLREGDAFAGCCGLRPYDIENDIPEMGLHICRRFWREGLAREAAHHTIEFAFSSLGVKGLFAGHHPENRASAKLMASLGFMYEGEIFYKPTGLMHPFYLLKK